MIPSQFTSWVKVYDTILSMGKGENIHEVIDFPINSTDSRHTPISYSVQDIMKHALNELMEARLTNDELRELRAFVNPSAPSGLRLTTRSIVDKIARVAGRPESA